MAQTLFINCRIYDGAAKKTVAGEVLVRGNRIEKVAGGAGKISRQAELDRARCAGVCGQPRAARGCAQPSSTSISIPSIT